MDPEVDKARAIYEETLSSYQEMEKHSGRFGGTNPHFSGRYRALMQNGQIRGIIAQFDQDRLGDWHEYYFFNGRLRYAYTKNILEEGHRLQTQRYFLDASGKLRRLEVNGRPVRPKPASEGPNLITSAQREITRVARQFYAIARLDQQDIPPALESAELVSSAEMTGAATRIPRAIPVAQAVSEQSAGDTPQTVADSAGEPAGPPQVAMNATAGGQEALTLEFQLLSRWADWANRTRADAGERTPLPPDLLLDLSVPDPEAGEPEAGLSLEEEPDADEEAALAAFRESATILESAGDPYVANANAIVRAGPGSNHRRIGLLKKGKTILVIIAVGEDQDWYRVRLADTGIDAGDLEEGYIYGELLDEL
jgi:hypothetical protein